MTGFWAPLILSIKLGLAATLLLFVLSALLVYLLSMYSFPGRSFLKAVVSMPLVLPPTVLGYYLLIAFSPDFYENIPLLDALDINLAFSFEGLVIAALLFSLPFMVNPQLSAIENLPSSLREASLTLGKSRFITYVRVILPNIKPAMLTACIMSFANTIGEFGVILMIGGSIPGETRVASVAIYQEVEALNFDSANTYALILLIFSLSVLTFTYYLHDHKQMGGRMI